MKCTSDLEKIAQKIRKGETVKVSHETLIELQDFALDIKDLTLYDKVQFLLEVRR